MRSSLRNLSILALSCSVALAIVFTQVPLLNVIGYETGAATGLFIALAGAILGFAAGRQTRRPGTELSPSNTYLINRQYFRCVLPGMAGIVMILIIIGTYTYYVRGCKLDSGVILFLSITIPTLLHCAAMGLFLGRTIRRWWVGVSIILVYIVGSGFFSLLEFLLGQRQVVHNLVIGLFSLTGYYGFDLVIPPSYYIYRVLISFFSIFFLGLAILMNPRGGAPGATDRLIGWRDVIAAVGVFLFCIIFMPDQTGLGSGHRMLENDLDNSIKTEYATLHFSRDTMDSKEIQKAAAHIDWYLAEIGEALDMELPEQIHVYLYQDGKQMELHTGARDFFFAQPWKYSLHIEKDDVSREITKHELTHTIMGEFGGGIFGTPYNIGVVEGIAVAVEKEYFRGPGFQEEFAAALKAGVLAPAQQTIGNVGFGATSMWKSYNMAGGFTGYLLYRYGADQYKSFYADPDTNKVYGKPLEQLNNDWEKWLDKIDVSPHALRHAELYYDDTAFPPFYKTPCPRVGEREPDENDPYYQLSSLRESGKHELKARLCEEIFEKNSDPKWLVRKGCEYIAAKDFASARETARRALEADRIRPDTKDRAYALLACSLASAGDYEGAIATLQKRKAYGFQDPEKVEQMILVVKNESVRELLAPHYIDPCDQARGSRRALQAAVDKDPDFGPAHGALAFSMKRESFPDEESYFQEMESHIEAFLKNTSALDHTTYKLMEKAGNSYFDAGLYNEAIQYYEKMNHYAGDERDRFLTARLVRRARFFRARLNDPGAK